MNIVFATDNNFVQHCATAIVSLLLNNKDSKVSIYILTEGLTPENIDLLKGLIEQKNGELHVIEVDIDKLKGVPMPKNLNLSHISIATYYRLLIPNLLPDSVDRVIYLDCDIIVRGSLLELWNTDINKAAIGAVYQIVDWNINAIRRLGYPTSFGYFNAGVLIVNLKYWRENLISNKLISFLENKYDKIVYHDQDALNGVLYDQCVKIDCKWNMLTGFLTKQIFSINDVDNGILINDYSDYKEQIRTQKIDPSIIHFVSKPKPWDVYCDHPFKKEYYYYLSFTPFKDYRPQNILLYSIKKPHFIIALMKRIIYNLIYGNPYS